MKTRQLRRYIAIVALISVGMSLLVHFNSILGLFAKENGFHTTPGHDTIAKVLSEVFVTAMVALCTFIVNYYIIRPLDGTKKVGIKRIFLSIPMTLISVYVLSDLFFALKHLVNDVQNPNKFVLLYFFRDMFMATVVLICVYVIKGFYEKQAVLIENEKLIRENLQSQYQSLKNQVSPHFLFNSLTALKELIDEDPKNALQYVGHLSMLLRYTLQSNENKTVPLKEEMESVRSYLYLIKMRFGSNLQIDFKISDEYNNFRLPPLVIQTLIENAVKHNEISKRNPLSILLMTTRNNSLIVSNPIREKLSLEPGTGIGLNNLSKQYKLLCGAEISISKSDGEFRVEVPLLKPNGNESSNS
jgi:LytS/YehU family sensor histidine kinase